MTGNQIAYHNSIETERHNRMMELETNRHQLADEALRARSNAIQALYNAELVRTNVANEGLKRAQNAIALTQLRETSRHNMSMEALQSSLNKSQIFRNYADSQVAFENVGLLRARTESEKTVPALNVAQTQQTGAETNRTNAQTGSIRQETELKGAQTTGTWAQTGSTIINAIGTIVDWIL